MNRFPVVCLLAIVSLCACNSLGELGQPEFPGGPSDEAREVERTDPGWDDPDDGTYQRPGTCDDPGPGVTGYTTPHDLPGVKVTGTGYVGDNSIKVTIETDALVVYVAGTYFEPKEEEEDDGFHWFNPQRMMISRDVEMAGPGTFYIDANCMDYNASAPGYYTQFYSSPIAPWNQVQYCQRDCGTDQYCVWDCETVCDDWSSWDTWEDGEDQSEDRPGRVPGSWWTEEEPEPREEVNGTWLLLRVKDSCDDGHPVYYRLFDQDSGLSYPPIGAWETQKFGTSTTSSFSCEELHLVCLGGEFNGTIVGVGLDGSGEPGAPWCFICGLSEEQAWLIGCDP